MQIAIKNLQPKDFEAVKKLFTITLTSNFKEEGILHSHPHELIEEIEAQIENVKLAIETDAEEEHYLLATLENQIIGTIAYGLPNEIIIKHLSLNSSEIPEIKSVYVLPKFQKRGVGNLLLHQLITRLIENGIQEFYLDCGYKSAQAYWKKQLGKPVRIIRDYWAKDSHHLIWHNLIDLENKRIVRRP